MPTSSKLVLDSLATLVSSILPPLFTYLRLFAFPFFLACSSSTHSTFRLPLAAACALKDVPGVSELQVTADNGDLEITGERNRAFERDNAFVHKSERFCGRVHRTISLPDSANGDAAKATLKNGVLTIDVPKFGMAAAKTTRRSLPVSSA